MPVEPSAHAVGLQPLVGRCDPELFEEAHDIFVGQAAEHERRVASRRMRSPGEQGQLAVQRRADQVIGSAIADLSAWLRTIEIDRLSPGPAEPCADELGGIHLVLDRKSTRLNSSHVAISYAVLCLKTKTER